jgi:hypothetical protein
MKGKTMKHLTAFMLIITACVACAGIAGFLTQETRSWAFIQSVGGMKISLQGNTLSVDCDVSGTRKVTVKPTMINSGLAVRKLAHKQFGKTIQLSLVTSVFEKGMSSSCKPLDLSAYPAGEYSVEYRDPDGTTHALGKITLKKQNP